jgi:hypothetical protein
VPASNCLRSVKRFRPRSKCQQTRGFRFGMWSSYLDPTFQKELKHRHRVARHKYMEALNRKLMWHDKQLPNYAKHLGLKGFMCSAWHGRDPKLDGRGAKFAIDEFDGRSFRAPERGIEDVEQNALDHLINEQTFQDDLRKLLFEVNQGRSKTTSSNTPKTQAEEQFPNEEKSPAAIQEFEIDPITNRKVYKNPTAKLAESARKSIHVPVKTFKGYQTQFANFKPRTDAPEETYGASTKVELPIGHVNRVGLKSATTSSSQFSQEATGAPNDVDDGYGIYDARVSYNEPFLAYEPDGQIESQEKPDPVNESLKIYEQNTEQKNAKHQPPSLKSSINDKISDLDGRRRDIRNKDRRRRKSELGKHMKQVLATLEQILADESSTSHYQKPTELNSTKEALKKFDSKVSYEKPFMAYEPDGQVNAEEKQVLIEECLKGYDSQTQYGQVYHSVPDGHTCPPQDAEAVYDKKHPPGPVYYNEPEGHAYESLPKDAEAVYDKKHPSGPVYCNEPDGHARESPPKDPEAIYDKKHSPGPVYCNEPDGHARESPPRDPEAVYDKKHPPGPVYCNEPDGHACKSPPRDPEAVYDRKHSYGPVYHNEPDGHAPESAAQDPEAVYDTKHLYGPVYHNELDGYSQCQTTAEDGLREYDSRVCYCPKSSSQTKYQKLFRHIEEPEISTSSTRSEAELKPADIRNPYLNRYRRTPSSSTNTVVTPKQKREISEESSRVSQTKRTPQVVRHKKMTGNFVRDFPEESAVKWSTGASEVTTLLPDNAAKIERNAQTAEKDYYDGLASKERFSRKPNTTRLQTSLDRSSVMKPIGKMTSSHETPGHPSSKQGEGELSASIASRLNSGHKSSTNTEAEKGPPGTSSSKSSKVDGMEHYSPLIRSYARELMDNLNAVELPPGTLAEKPTHYKILAYDSSTQSVSMAPIYTSFKVDSSSPPTPADVIPRLSNPAKFFPYFEQLLTEGFQIASGSGDVLVFRKVRGSTVTRGATMASNCYQPNMTRINPIDGMRPVAATGNFLSPTGFVNYEYPPEEPVEARFKSNIDVRREEPVFSGKKIWEDEPEPKRGRGKRLLIGAAWVGACAYAGGVMHEFFHTGGLDGRGPVGF